MVFHGPSGCGKTLLARVIAAEAKANFLWVSPADLLSEYLGESEEKLRSYFTRARQATPCILFIDEIDAVLPSRGLEGVSSSVESRLLTTMLNEMDGVKTGEDKHGVVVLAATNRLDALDPALLRPGRLQEQVFLNIPSHPLLSHSCQVLLGLPTESDRLELLKFHASSFRVDPSVNFELLASDDSSSGWSCSQCQHICQQAFMRGLGRRVSSAGLATSDEPVIVTQEDFQCN